MDDFGKPESRNFPVGIASAGAGGNCPSEDLAEAFETKGGYDVTLTDNGFASDDPAFDALVVDWKIGDSNADPLQLAIYRQAWAKARGLEPGRVATAFHHVLANRLEPVVASPELIRAATAAIIP